MSGHVGGSAVATWRRALVVVAEWRGIPCRCAAGEGGGCQIQPLPSRRREPSSPRVQRRWVRPNPAAPEPSRRRRRCRQPDTTIQKPPHRRRGPTCYRWSWPLGRGSRGRGWRGEGGRRGKGRREGGGCERGSSVEKFGFKTPPPSFYSPDFVAALQMHLDL